MHTNGKLKIVKRDSVYLELISCPLNIKSDSSQIEPIYFIPTEKPPNTYGTSKHKVQSRFGTDTIKLNKVHSFKKKFNFF